MCSDFKFFEGRWRGNSRTSRGLPRISLTLTMTLQAIWQRHHLLALPLDFRSTPLVMLSPLPRRWVHFLAPSSLNHLHSYPPLPVVGERSRSHGTRLKCIFWSVEIGISRVAYETWRRMRNFAQLQGRRPGHVILGMQREIYAEGKSCVNRAPNSTKLQTIG